MAKTKKSILKIVVNNNAIPKAISMRLFRTRLHIIKPNWNIPNKTHKKKSNNKKCAERNTVVKFHAISGA